VTGQASLFDFQETTPRTGNDQERQHVEDERTLAGHGYKLVTLKEFNAADDVPKGNTREVVRRIATSSTVRFVVYEPHGDDRYGWLLVGTDRAALARETVEFRCRPRN
jgi:hypothetical protein